jgi:dipeptidyl aminopeptidase/acylaminoacyl peptidase
MIRFAVEDQQFELHLESYEIRGFPGGSEAEEHRNRPRVVRAGIPSYEPPVLEVISPDGRWFAGVEDHNLYVRSCCEDRYVQLTADGAGSYEWDVFEAQWSPDSSKLAVKKIDEWGASRQVFIVDISTRRRFAVDLGETQNAFVGILGWLPDGSELIVERVNATLNELELRAADAGTAETRLILRESQSTNLQTDYRWWRRYFTLLADGKKFILMSQRNGWNHLYLYDRNGKLLRQLTDGPMEVVEVVAVNLEAGWIYFTAQGDKQRPYDTHLYRVNLEGKGRSRLTEASGQHSIEFAPSKKFYLDRHSSVSRPPEVELRRADGALLQVVSEADVTALEGLNWSPPEEFVVKAADGVTDLHGVLYRPFDFDPNRSYPVIENIYGAPALTVTPRTFVSEPDTYDTYGRGLAQAQLGFIVFVVDARGTPGRGREFSDSGDIDRHVIADHVAVLKQLAAQRPYMERDFFWRLPDCPCSAHRTRRLSGRHCRRCPGRFHPYFY